MSLYVTSCICRVLFFTSNTSLAGPRDARNWSAVTGVSAPGGPV
jgi:hypothetical protein